MPRLGGEERTITGTDAPITRERLAADLGRLGVRPGGVVLVHSSLSALGWVCGGAETVVQALLDALGRDGTLVVPTHTTGNSEPSAWQHPPVPQEWWSLIREHMPAYDRATTPSRALGVIVEAARTWPGARRSDHPQYSFAAIGSHAGTVTAGHALESGFGERSPLARVYDLDGDVVLLGVGHAANTSLHLAEHRVPDPPREPYGAAVLGPGGRRWTTWEDVLADASDFEALGAAFDATGAVTTGRVGMGETRLMRQRELVAFAVEWMREHRGRCSRRPRRSTRPGDG
jgi:aminoglycoside 3-N-acetyltransferase